MYGFKTSNADKLLASPFNRNFCIFFIIMYVCMLHRMDLATLICIGCFETIHLFKYCYKHKIKALILDSKYFLIKTRVLNRLFDKLW